MATTSGTYIFSETVSQIISRSYRQISAIQEGETPSSPMINDALTALGAMVKAWSASQIHVWAEEESILFLNPKQPQYSIGPGSLDHACPFNGLLQNTLAATATTGATSVTVTSAFGMQAGDQFGIQLDAGVNFWSSVNGAPAGNVVTLRAALPSQATSGAIVFDYPTSLVRPLRVPANGARRYLYSSQIETPIIGMSRTDYDYLPNKYNIGEVTQFFYDPQTIGQGAGGLAVGLFNVWPAPADNTNAVRFVAQRQMQDIGSIANTADFPDEWITALTWNLALEMAPEFDVPASKYQIIKDRAEYWLNIAQNWDKEPEPILMGYATEPGYR
jgi:hypothetical protein